MVSRWRITALLSLCLVGTLACGFSSWIYSESISASTGEITVGVGDIKTNADKVIFFQSATVSSVGKKGFRHDETVVLKENNKDVSYDVSYYDNNYEISSIWKIKPSSIVDFEYSITQNFKNGASYNLLSSAKAENLTATSYDSYDEASKKVGGNVISGTSVSNVTYGSDCLSMNISVPKTESDQYLCITYKNTVSIPSDSDFETAVYDKIVSSIHSIMSIDFDVALNKVVQ